jgi:hypothetical protein
LIVCFDLASLVSLLEKNGESIVRDPHCERMEDIVSEFELLNAFQKRVSILGKIGYVTFPTLQKS